MLYIFLYFISGGLLYGGHELILVLLDWFQIRVSNFKASYGMEMVTITF